MRLREMLGLVSSVLLLAAHARGEDAAPKAPVPTTESARKMTMPEGFTSTLFAAEPDVHQPIAFTIDPRGRLWVAEGYSYPSWLPGAVLNKDRILILEDTDGDGKHDKRTVFWEGGNNVTGLALGFGGVYVCATPNLLFIPDKNGDDVPDGPPVVKLDGWDEKAQHNMFNALNWAPDGWLWGCNGILSNSKVGKPGTPDDQRVSLNCGVWRYHPTREIFEAVAHGTTNPWGLDFDEYGEAFITNCVIPHLYRVTPGAHFQRMFGQDINRYSFGLIESAADHIHWAGGRWQDSRGGAGKHGEAGGGHAHAGAMIYLGDNWPDRYRNGLFTCNIHGHRVNHDTMTQEGSGTVARHAPDFLMANDDWFRGLELKYGPDGAVYLTDWSDTGECHETDGDNAHRENGRIYKVAFGQTKPVTVDLAKLPSDELARLQLHKNDWHVRTARRLLQERASGGADLTSARGILSEILSKNPDDTRKLRALWALNAIGGIDAVGLRGLLDQPSEHVRSWAIRLISEDAGALAGTTAKLADMAGKDASPRVRLAIASALQRLVPDGRWDVARALIAHGEDSRDNTLSLMDWYAIEPLVGLDPSRGVSLVADCRVPLLRRHIARRAVLADDEANGKGTGMSALARGLDASRDSATRADLLGGMLDALEGRKGVRAPGGWPATFEHLLADGNADVRTRAILLSLRFGDPRAAELLGGVLADRKAPAANRREALQALVEARVGGLAPRLQGLLDDADVRGPALRALAAYDDKGTPAAILRVYPALGREERDDAVNTLAARADFALALLDAVGAGKVPSRDVSTTVARQLQALGKPDVSSKLEAVWGSLRATSGDKAAQMSRYKALVAEGGADAARGRLVFERACLQCHKLYDQGGDVGPDLTGSDRANLDYVLENVLDPSASVGRDFRLTTAATTDGRVISGIVREQGEKTIVLQTVNERVVLPREDIEEFKESPSSMMPEGLLDKLTPAEVRDLLGYLATKGQVAPGGGGR